MDLHKYKYFLIRKTNTKYNNLFQLYFYFTHYTIFKFQIPSMLLQIETGKSK